jgi:hypothetical protein
LYFALVGRNQRVFSPEEEFAVSMGERGHPELGDYGSRVGEQRPGETRSQL